MRRAKSGATGLLRVLCRSKGVQWTTAAAHRLYASSPAPASSGAASDAPVVKHKLPACKFDPQEQRSLQHATEVIERLRSDNALALIVGGWVRDKYLNRPSLDIDIATSASISQVRRLFGKVTSMPRSTVKLHHQGDNFEITQFRGVSRGADLHSAGLDAGMRDFTMNALFYDPIEQTVLDFVGGVADLQRRELRLCVDPDKRLADDPLRALRAVRFAVSLGLKFPAVTRNAIERMAHLCCSEKDISPRRIYLELRKLNDLEAKQPGSFANALKLCYRLGLLRGLLPFLDGDNALQQGVNIAEKLPGEMPLELRLAAMVNPNSKGEVYEQACMYCQSVHERANVTSLAGMHELPLVTSSNDCHALIDKYANEHAPLLVDIVAAWMRPEVAPQFKQHHLQRMQEWASDIKAVRQQRQQQQQALAAARREARAQSAGHANLDAEVPEALSGDTDPQGASTKGAGGAASVEVQAHNVLPSGSTAKQQPHAAGNENSKSLPASRMDTQAEEELQVHQL